MYRVYAKQKRASVAQTPTENERARRKLKQRRQERMRMSEKEKYKEGVREKINKWTERGGETMEYKRRRPSGPHVVCLASGLFTC